MLIDLPFNVAGFYPDTHHLYSAQPPSPLTDVWGLACVSRVSAIVNSSPRRLQTVRDFQAFPLGLWDLSSRPSVSNSPVSNMDGLVMFVSLVCRDESLGFACRSASDKSLVGPASVRTVNAYVLLSIGRSDSRSGHELNSEP